MNESPWRTSTYSGGANSNCVEVASWRKSTYSGGANSTCVEVATADEVLVRDTKDNGTGPVLRVPGAAWTAFLATLR